MTEDRIYSQPHGQLNAFQFDEQVAKVFSDMIRRSVPGYAMSLEMLGVIARHYVQPNSVCYDLGCSLGASTLSIRHNLQNDSSRIVGVDNSEAMLSQCQQILDTDKATAPVELRCENIQDTEISNASMAVLNFTLQFIPVAERLGLLQKIYQGLNKGGVLVLSEKIELDNPADQSLLTDLHHDFKRQQGYSELEVAQKRASIENVLIPETVQAHQQRLKDAGFSHSTLWLQCFNFVSLIAIK